MVSATQSDIAISAAEIEAVLDPWTIERHSAEAKAWKRVRARKSRAYWKREIGRILTGKLLPMIKASERQRKPEFVLDHYTETWSRYVWPDPGETPSKQNTVFLEWRGNGYTTLRHGLVICHLLGIAKVVDQLRPTSVLEIGAGPGINLVSLAAMFPEIAYSGAELTASGVATAKLAQNEELPESVEHFAPLKVVSRTAHQSIDFNQADVRQMPFPDEAFDLVFTRLAVEQMENIRDAALAEIHRVTKTYAVFVEPFADLNTTALQSLATRSKNYLSLRMDDLSGHGFEPIFRYSDWPHKITNAAGLVLCRKVARSN